MAASRTEADTIPAELIRQSDRVKEQLTCLTTILNSVNQDLNEMNSMMKNYSPELCQQISALYNYLESYKGKSQKIYNEVSESLFLYASNLLNNITELTKDINQIGQAVENL